MTELKEINWAKLNQIINKHKDKPWSLIPLLQELVRHLDGVLRVENRLIWPPSDVTTT